MKENMFTNKNTLTKTAFLGAIAIIMSFLESMFDFALPVPGIKIGLSNVIVALSVELLGFVPSLCIVILKAAFAGLTRGAIASIMSFSGGFLSFIVMIACLKCKFSPFGYLGTGVMGALFHNAGQFFVAFIVVEKAIINYIPILIISALITGCITGTAMGVINPKLVKIFGSKKPFL